MNGLTISVAMCTFNGGQFLRAQLESIAAQTRPPDELVVCDDASHDDSAEVVRNFAERCPFPVPFVVNERNLKSTKNFEQAILRCRGDIIVLADQDDIWYPQKLERFESIFSCFPDTVAAFSDADLIDENSNPLGTRLWSTFSFDQRKQTRFASGHALEVLIRHPVVTGATMAFRKVLFGEMTPIPEGEVHDRWISFLLAVRGHFELVPEPLMQYRRHQNQQLGPGPLTLRGQVNQAKSRGEYIYRREIERFQDLYDQLGAKAADSPNVQYVRAQIRRKITHLDHRAALAQLKGARIPAIFREALNGNYWRYSGGWKSIANDLLIR